MTKEEILAAAKLRTRKSGTDILDQDVQRHIDVALADLKRIGVHEDWLNTLEDPMIVEAVLSYVNANYQIAGDKYERLIASYNMTITKIKGSGMYFRPKEG